MKHPLSIGSRCRLTRSHLEILRREGRVLSEAEQTLTIIRSGIVGRDIHPDEEGCYLEGGVGYVVQFANDDDGSHCSIGFEELDDHYEVVPSEIHTDTRAVASHEAMKAYCSPKTCFNPRCNGEREADKKCARCKWATYCSQECQMMHWKAHKRECSSVTTANNYMFGRPDFTKNKEKYKCPPIRYDVDDVKGSILTLSTTIMGKKAIREFTCEQHDILETVIAYFENGRGCSVDIQREADGSDIVSAVYNESASTYNDGF